jgi:hypothetical protein
VSLNPIDARSSLRTRASPAPVPDVELEIDLEAFVKFPLKGLNILLNPKQSAFEGRKNGIAAHTGPKECSSGTK